jgi:hypothetical protein
MKKPKISDIKTTKDGTLRWKKADVSWALNICQNENDFMDIEPCEMKDFKVISEKDRKICVWRNHDLLGKNFEIKVEWQILEERLSGKLSWKGGNGKVAIEKLFFPLVKLPMPKDGSIFVPKLQGRIYRKLNDKKIYPDGCFFMEGQCTQMQYSAVISPELSYYFDQRDTDFHVKTFDFRAIENFSKISCKCVHSLPLDGKSSRQYKAPYPSSIAVFKGGWFEAAQIYKKWARQQKWAKRPPVDSRLRDIGIWLWNRGPAEHVINPVEKFADESGVPVALDWYWWHKNAYDTSYPDYWPPREGTAVFKKALSRLKKRDIYSQVYINGATWDMDAEHWKKGGSDSVVINRDGSEMAVMFNVFAKKRLSWMCGNDNQPFRKKIKETIKKLKAAGLPGVYLDMIGCSTNPRTCYNKKHRHAPGGGNHQMSGYREMLKEIQKEIPDFPLSTEEASEAYMDLFDSAISLSGGLERLGSDPNIRESVPAFSAVYHGLNAVFGNYAMPDSIPPFDPKWPESSEWKKEKEWRKLYPDQFFFEIARSVIWGLQPTVANFKMEHCEKPGFKEMYEFLLKTARFYHSHREFLFDGDMLNPGVLKTKEIAVKFLSRFIFTAEGKEKTFRKKNPAILHSLWKTPDGRIALILANYSSKTQSFEFESQDMSLSGKIPPRSWMLQESL